MLGKTQKKMFMCLFHWLFPTIKPLKWIELDKKGVWLCPNHELHKDIRVETTNREGKIYNEILGMLMPGGQLEIQYGSMPVDKSNK